VAHIHFQKPRSPPVSHPSKPCRSKQSSQSLRGLDSKHVCKHQAWPDGPQETAVPVQPRPLPKGSGPRSPDHDHFFLNCEIMGFECFMLNSSQINFFVNQKRCLHFELDIHTTQEAIFQQRWFLLRFKWAGP